MKEAAVGSQYKDFQDEPCALIESVPEPSLISEEVGSQNTGVFLEFPD